MQSLKLDFKQHNRQMFYAWLLNVMRYTGIANHRSLRYFIANSVHIKIQKITKYFMYVLWKHIINYHNRLWETRRPLKSISCWQGSNSWILLNKSKKIKSETIYKKDLITKKGKSSIACYAFVFGIPQQSHELPQDKKHD